MENRRELGSALIETAMSLPIFLLLLAGTVDFGRWFSDYLTISRLTYEAARYAASYPGLEVCSGSVQNPDGTASACPSHSSLQTRVNYLLNKKDPVRFPVDGSQSPPVWTARTMQAAAGAGEAAPSVVSIKISVPFHPQFFSFLDKVSSRVEAPYLFRNN